MAKVCARCGVRFPGGYGLRLIWCKVDRFYVCRPCWEAGCGEGHGQGVKARETYGGKALAAAFGIVLILPWIPPIANDYLVLAAWRDSPLAPLGAVQEGHAAKVAGTIEDTDAVALGGHEVHGKSSWSWVWNERDSFILRNGSDAIRVETGHWYHIAPGPRPAPNRVHTDGTAYLAGDSAIVFGPVRRSENGTLYLDALVVGTNPADPSPSLLLLGFGTFLVSLLIAVFVWAAVDARTKRRDHRKAVGWRNSVDLDTNPVPRPSGLDWRANGTSWPSRARVPTLLAVVAIVACIVLLVWVSLDPHEPSDYFVLSTIVMFLSMIPILPVGVWAAYHESGPSALALSDTGIHFWYDNPYDRHLNDDLVPWSEVKVIERRKAGRSSYWALERTTGEVDNLGMLIAANRDAVVAAWRGRKAPSARSQEGAVGPA